MQTFPLSPRPFQLPGTPSKATLIWSIKWIASVAQILGYGATAFGATPLNIYLFLVGLLGWFAVGVFWQDRAIMLIHVIALGAMLVGLAGGTAP